MIAQRPLFRAQALKEYRENQERGVLPPAVRPPVLLICWLLLGLLLAATVLAWQAQVAISVEAAGAIVQETQTMPHGSGQSTALLFVPASSPLYIPPGQTISVQLTGQAELLRATIDSVEPGLITPDQARQRYGLTGDLAWVITHPSVVVTLVLHTDLSAPSLAGRSIHAQIPVGSQSLLSLLSELLQAL